MNNNKFIKGTGIYFRELQEIDLDGNWYKWFNDPEITFFQNKGIFPNTKEKQRQYYDFQLNSHNDVVFAIIEEASEKHIGNVGLHHINWVSRSAELGIVLGEKNIWGKGYGKQSWQLITEYGFQVLNLHRIFAQIIEGNISSCKSAEAAGFKREGLIRDFIFKNGKYLNMIYYNSLKTYHS
jgi:ribosomal-protein-alanine N-acetyltransferase